MDKEKLKHALRMAVLVCEYRGEDICTQDGYFAATDMQVIIALEEALCDLLDTKSDDVSMLEVQGIINNI